MINQDTHCIIAKATVGIAANTIGLLTSMQEQFEWILRCGSLLIGISVGLLSAWSILRGGAWSKRGKKKEQDPSDEDPS